VLPIKIKDLSQIETKPLLSPSSCRLIF
jgi:hypothetical protein